MKKKKRNFNLFFWMQEKIFQDENQIGEVMIIYSIKD